MRWGGKTLQICALDIYLGKKRTEAEMTKILRYKEDDMSPTVSNFHMINILCDLLEWEEELNALV